MQKLLTEFPDLANSGRHNSAMITDRRKFTSKWSLYTGCLLSIFTVRINSVFPLDCTFHTRKVLTKFSATSDVRYCVSIPIVRRIAGAA